MKWTQTKKVKKWKERKKKSEKLKKEMCNIYLYCKH